MSAVNPTTIQDIDGILWGYKWDVKELTFSFPTSTSSYQYDQINDFEAFTASQQAAAIRALDAVETFADIHFTQVAGHGTMVFAEAETFAVKPGDPLADDLAGGIPPDPDFQPAHAHGDMWFEPGSFDATELGEWGQAAIMHEVGHALGLKHGDQTNWEAHGQPFPALPYAHDSSEFSIMTYREYVGSTNMPNPDNEQPQSYMMLDIQALQHLYGANWNYNSGNTVYQWSPDTGALSLNGDEQIVPARNYIFQTIWDGGGADTYDFSNYGTTDLKVDLAPGGWTTLAPGQIAHLGGTHWARGSIANALLYQGSTASLIENAKGSDGDDEMRGNQVRNILTGNGGRDFLDGREGYDRLVGGEGDDLYHLDDVSLVEGKLVYDQIVEVSKGGGTDFVSVWRATAFNQTITHYTLAANIENGAVVGGGDFDLTGNEYSNRLAGNGDNNVLRGEAGNDTLDGGGDRDFLRGGEGNDLYKLADASFFVGHTAFDGIYEEADAGIDTVEVRRASSGATTLTKYWLGANIENATVTGLGAFDVNGNGHANILLGNHSANLLAGFGEDDTIRGNGGADELSGGGGNDHLEGGAGKDIMSGGSGRDSFDFSAVSDSGNSAATRDVITDFNAGLAHSAFDLIGLAGLDANIGTFVNDAFVFIGSNAFTADAAGQVRVTQHGGNTIVEFNVDGDAASEMQIEIAGLHDLTALDFVL